MGGLWEARKRTEKVARGSAGWERDHGREEEVIWLPDTLTCVQVLTSSGQPWGLLHLSFSL